MQENTMPREAGSASLTGQASGVKKIIIAEFIILLGGMLFAWGNFTWELINYLNNKACTTGCVISTTPVNPIYTPCFFGAIFFTIAFVLSAILLKKINTK